VTAAHAYSLTTATKTTRRKNSHTLLARIITGVETLIPNPFWAAEAWADQHPEDLVICCMAAVATGAHRCTCWKPVYAQPQREPVPVDRPELLLTQATMCHDCAYRPGSPERADEHLTEEITTLPEVGTPFWCHQGMRRPTHWEHPDGRRIDAHPDDWHPARAGNFIYQQDGSPALLCAGWTYRRMNSCRTQ
jgi:hypothetical protein